MYQAATAMKAVATFRETDHPPWRRIGC